MLKFQYIAETWSGRRGYSDWGVCESQCVEPLPKYVKLQIVNVELKKMKVSKVEDKMILDKHKGPRVKRGGVIVKEEDYDGKYAVRFVTESGEEQEFVLNRAQVDRLNTLTEEPIGRCETDDSLSARVKEALNPRS